MKAILIPKKKRRSLKSQMKPILRTIGKLAIAEMEKTTATWDNVEPDFHFELDDFKVTVGPRDNEDGLIWHFLNGGTSERWAIMTPDFIAKTTPGFVGAGAGAGGFSHFAQEPVEGIEAREWTEEIVKTLQPVFEKAVAELMEKLTI